MTKPDIVWVLPNRGQSADEDVFKDGKQAKLTEALPVSDFPKELVLGVPAGILERYGTADVVFAQYCRQPNSCRQYFTLSVPCGTDRDGRSVYLTLLEILPDGASPQVFPDEVCWPEEFKALIGQLEARYASGSDPWMVRVKKMLAAAGANPKLKTFASVAVPQAVFPTEWTPGTKLRRAILCLVVSLTVIGVLLALVHALRSCLH